MILWVDQNQGLLFLQGAAAPAAIGFAIPDPAYEHIPMRRRRAVEDEELEAIALALLMS